MAWSLTIGLLLALGVPCALAHDGIEHGLDGATVLQRWTTEDGLPLDHVTGLDFAPDGAVWIATMDGLARLDGHSVRVFRQGFTPGLHTSRFTDIRVDASGVVWAVNQEEGILVAIERGQVRQLLAEVLPGKAVRLQRIGHQVWVGCSAGAAVLSGGDPHQLPLELEPLHPVQEGRNGSAWLAGGGALVELRVDGDSVQELRRFAIDGDVRSMIEDDEGGIWAVGWNERAWRGEPGQALREVFSPEGPLPKVRLVGAEDGRTWFIGTERAWIWDGALARSAPTGQPPPPHPDTAPWQVLGPRLYADGALVYEGQAVLEILAVEPGGAVWVHEHSRGLLRGRPSPITTVGHASLGSADCVGRTADGAVLICQDDGLTRWDGVDFSEVLNPLGDSLGWTTSILTNRSGRTLASSKRGMVEVEGGLGSPAAVHETRVYAMDEADDGTLWLGGPRGLWRAPPGSAASELVQGTAEATIRSLLILSNGEVLAGSSAQGLLLVRDGEVAWRGADAGLSNGSVRGMWRAPDGQIWFGTEGGGLCRLGLEADSPLGSAPLGCIGVQHGLPEGFVSSVVADGQGRLWLSGNQGLTMLDHDDAVAVIEGHASQVSPVRFDQHHGMLEPETNGRFAPRVARDGLGRLLYPTQHGLAILDPRRVASLEPPAVTLTHLAVDGRVLEPPGGEPPTLGVPAEAKVIELSWSAPAFEHADDLRFRTRLVGRSDAWSEPTTARTVSWVALPTGSYTVELQAGWAGRWGPTVRLLHVQKQPAFFERMWFFVLIVAGLALVALVLSWIRLRQTRRRQLELEAVIRERTEQLAQRGAELAVRNTRLQELDSLRSSFVANISHELRTPLSLVTAPLYALDDAPLEAHHRRSLELAQRSGERLAALVEQLMDVGRMDESGVPLRARRLDLAAFVRRSVERFESLAASRQIGLAVLTPVQPVPAWFDADLIDKVLTNVIGNALKFTPMGGRVVVTASEPDQHGEYATIAVNDTGPGIPPALRDRVFERFYQVDPSETRRHGGTGIGLALARELVELHGGSLRVTSGRSPLSYLQPEPPLADEDEAGKGACFLATLPLTASHLDIDEVDLEDAHQTGGIEPAATIPPEPPESAEDLRHHLPLVLVVEDHADMRAYLCEQLSAAFRVHAAEDGLRALERLIEDRPDVLVSDIMMPELDGLELCRRVREDPALADLPVLLLSAKASEADRVAGMELADDYVTKPFRMRELIARVRRLAERSRDKGKAVIEAGETEPEVRHSAEDRAILERLEAVVAAELSQGDFRTTDMAKACRVSVRQLHRKVGELCDTTPAAYLREARLDHARRIMRDGVVTTVKEAAAAVGMSRAHFSRTFTNWAGHPPSDVLSDEA